MQPVSRQRIGKHVPAAMNTHATTELLLETVFSNRAVQRSYKEDNWSNFRRGSKIKDITKIVLNLMEQNDH
jgi:hypothetical protein